MELGRAMLTWQNINISELCLLKKWQHLLPIVFPEADSSLLAEVMSPRLCGLLCLPAAFWEEGWEKNKAGSGIINSPADSLFEVDSSSDFSLSL